jgi:MoaA/NifB/PqqE/SkfB family radical SAM enzyme
MPTVDIARSLISFGRTDEAERLTRRAIGADPGDASAGTLVALLLSQEKLEEAVTLAEQTLAAAPYDPLLLDLYRQVGLALFHRWFWEDALPWLERAAALEPWDSALAALVERARPRDYLAPEVEDRSLGRVLRRYSPREGAGYIYVIDIVGTCNLRCPTCPVGNSVLGARPRGMMKMEMFRRIVAKIRAESPSPRPHINLFNWGEPLLHPQLPAFIRILREAGMESHLSTNLNIRRGLEAMVRAGPDDLKLSLSGFTPETYERSHAGGDLERVKANMIALREMLDRHNAPTNVWVSHHLYRHNLHEADAVRAFCTSLRFTYNPIQAFYMPLERVADLLDGKPNSGDSGIVAELLLDPVENNRRIASRRGGGFDCELRFNQTVINHDGTVALCCSVYDQSNMLGFEFLDHPHADIERHKYEHSFCKKCIKANLHYTRLELRPDMAADSGASGTR